MSKITRTPSAPMLLKIAAIFDYQTNGTLRSSLEASLPNDVAVKPTKAMFGQLRTAANYSLFNMGIEPWSSAPAAQIVQTVLFNSEYGQPEPLSKRTITQAIREYGPRASSRAKLRASIALCEGLASVVASPGVERAAVVNNSNADATTPVRVNRWARLVHGTPSL